MAVRHSRSAARRAHSRQPIRVANMTVMRTLRKTSMKIHISKYRTTIDKFRPVCGPPTIRTCHRMHEGVRRGGMVLRLVANRRTVHELSSIRAEIQGRIDQTTCTNVVVQSSAPCPSRLLEGRRPRTHGRTRGNAQSQQLPVGRNYNTSRTFRRVRWRCGTAGALRDE